jgi:hypothetical protein
MPLSRAPAKNMAASYFGKKPLKEPVWKFRVRRALFLTLVKSQLTYGSEVWCPSSIYLCKKIEGVQRRATLWILGKKRGEMTYVERLTELNLIPLVYDREDIILYFKCKNNYVDLVSHSMSKLRQAEHVQAPLAFYEPQYVEQAHSKTRTLSPSKAPCEGTNSPRLFTPGEMKALAKSKVHQLSRAWVTNRGWSS